MDMYSCIYTYVYVFLALSLYICMYMWLRDIVYRVRKGKTKVTD